MTPKPLPTVTSLNAPFYEAAARGVLALQRCTECGERIFYPRRWCPSCWASGLVWEDTSGNGVVGGFSVVHQAPFESYQDVLPYVLAMVRLDEGPQMMANIVDCDPGTVSVGTKVRIVFEQRGGLAIPQFTPR